MGQAESIALMLGSELIDVVLLYLYLYCRESWACTSCVEHVKPGQWICVHVCRLSRNE